MKVLRRRLWQARQSVEDRDTQARLSIQFSLLEGEWMMALSELSLIYLMRS